MGLAALATRIAETRALPDTVTRLGVGLLVRQTRRRMQTAIDAECDFARDMRDHPIAQAASTANSQHYEVPAAFFRNVLGPRLKYSSCLFVRPEMTLAEAEEAALEATCAHAQIADGQRILELGCGWGSLTLWLAERYPAAHITAVSNSNSQRLSIEAEARARGLANLTIVTADMNVFDTDQRFDRVVSVEMFEHMANWRALLSRITNWLAPRGRLFLHVFTHVSTPYRFDAADRDDWVGQHFFTGGIMPSHGLIRRFPDLFQVEEEWRWSGENYRRTADAWLANMDGRTLAIDGILQQTYGVDAGVWKRRWRLFFMATAGLFGDNGGDVWGVSHYRLAPASESGA